jgi:hypothetical protein
VTSSIQPKCSQATADAIAACDDEEIKDGCPYPGGSGAKVEWLRERQQRFGEHLVPNKKLAKRRRKRDNITAEEMDSILWGQGRDNPAVIPRPPGIKGGDSERLIVAKLHFRIEE